MLLSATINLVVQALLRFLALGVFLALLSHSNGLSEADTILPEDPAAIVPDDYGLKVPKQRYYASNAAEDNASQVSEADAAHDIASFIDSAAVEKTGELGQAKKQLADLLVQKCAPTGEFTQSSKPWVKALCENLDGPSKQALRATLAALGDAALTSYDDNSIAFSVDGVKIGDAHFGWLYTPECAPLCCALADVLLLFSGFQEL